MSVVDLMRYFGRFGLRLEYFMKIFLLIGLMGMGFGFQAHASVECRYGTTEEGLPYVSISANGQSHARIGYRNHEERNEALKVCQNKALIQCAIVVKRVEVVPADGEGVKYSRHVNETFFAHETFETVFGYRAEMFDRVCDHHATIESCEKSAAENSANKLKYLTEGFSI